MKLAFICAMPEEFRAVACNLKDAARVPIGHYIVGSGNFAGHDVMVVESGMGFDNAARATETLLGYKRPDVLISVGFCGGIAPELGVGDVIVATGLVIVSGNVVDEVPVKFSDAGSNFIVRQSKTAHPVIGGLFVSTPAITSKSKIAALLPTGVANPVVEMESAAIAMIAAENGIPFAAIRSISDPASEELGFTLNEFCDSSKHIRIPRVLLTIIRKPHIIPQLFRLARNSKIAEASLARAVKDFLASA
jgi:adenosylhomocysteine nucleosidase